MAKIEYCRVAAVVAALECGKVGDSVLVDIYLRDRIIDANVIEIPLRAENGDDANACLGMLHLEQRRIGVRTGAINREAVEVDAEAE